MKKHFGKFFMMWDQALQSGAVQVGGKGWNLARLNHFGFKVPPGGVLSSNAYAEFIDYNGFSDDIADIAGKITAANLGDYTQELSRLEEKIKSGLIPRAISDEISAALQNLGLLDKAIAVRSSATAEDSAAASFAGIHESFLNVRGLENILAAIKGCYASLWTARAVAYRRKMELADNEVLPAVVLLEMVAAQSAGVGFTCDPQTGRRNVLVINANFGLGESVVSGEVEPDSYYLDAQLWNPLPCLLKRNTGRKQGFTRPADDGGTELIYSDELSSRPVLSDEEIEKLGLLLMRVFESLGECEQHQDVEWAYEGRDFFLLQARPVTALPEYTFAALQNQTTTWSNGNYRDAAPMVVSPLQRRFLKHIIDTIQYTQFPANGYQIPEGFEFSRYFNGRLYCNMSALQWAYYDCLGSLPDFFNDFWGGHQPQLAIDDPDPYAGEAGRERQQRGMNMMNLVMEAAKDAPRIFAEVPRSAQAVTGTGFDELPDSEFNNKYTELGRIVRTYCEKFPFLAAVGTMPVMSLLQKLYEYFGTRAIEVLNGLMVGGQAGITSADHGYRLLELAELARRDEAAVRYLRAAAFNPFLWEAELPASSPFKQAFRAFIEEYGHRAVYELDIINPRWKEDPTYPLDIIRNTMDTARPDDLKVQQKLKFERTWQEVANTVPADVQEEVRLGIKTAQEGAAVREMTKSVLVMATESYRLMARELGQRLYRRGLISEPDDVFFCSWPDLFSILHKEWNGDGLKALVEFRKMSCQRKETIPAPDIICGEKPVFSGPAGQSSGDCLRGVAAANGRASGIARLIAHPSEGNRLQPGEILVAPSTDPAWTPLFLKAGAIVMETGGFLSHGSIVAREYGIPAVVNVAGAMRIIADGQEIIVDGNAGTVRLEVAG
ncbi:MAG: PEP/pyruvate-binding domain-containing protein [Syntrophomonas sp.]